MVVSKFEQGLPQRRKDSRLEGRLGWIGWHGWARFYSPKGAEGLKACVHGACPRGAQGLKSGVHGARLKGAQGLKG
eukprot:101343-Chlamydomonas_euryale.AAC.2